MVSAFTRMRVSNFVRAPSSHHSTTNHVIVLHRGGRLNMLPRRARQTGTSHEECWFNDPNLRHRTESTLENSRQVVVPPAANTSPSFSVCPSLSSLRLGPSHHALRALSPTAIRYRPSEQARRNPDAKQTHCKSPREKPVSLCQEHPPACRARRGQGGKKAKPSSQHVSACLMKPTARLC
jgi:hypothetical protein